MSEADLSGGFRLSSGDSFGPYIIGDTLGHNATSAVYKARHKETDREVALRVLPPSVDKAQAERFMKEIEIVTALRHPCIVPIIDSGTQGDTVYIAMPRLDGGTLDDKLNQRRLKHKIDRDDQLPEEALPSLGEVAAMVERLAAGLDYLHSKNIIHHHVQPGNILFDREGRPYLADTGVAKLLKVIFSLKETNAIGTHPFSPPEQWQGESLSPASDQYALAGVAYLLITGRLMFEASSIYGMMVKHMNDFFIPPHQLRPGLPGGLTIIMLRSLAKSPEDRYPSVLAFSQDLKNAIKDYEGTPTDFFSYTPPRTKVPPHQVYIIHSEQNIDIMQRLIDDLKARGVTAWQDDKIQPGSISWKASLRDVVKEVGLVVVLLTPGALKSDWVEMGLSYAKRFEKPVFGLLLEGTDVQRGVMEGLADARANYASGVDALAKAIKQKLKVGASQ